MKILILCLTIFFCRILDVSLGTMRTIITVKGKKFLASLIGFFEVLIWFLVVREALNTEEKSIWIAIAYALGYALGTIIGSLLAQTVIKTKVIVQVITTNRNKELVDRIHEEGYPTTIMEVYGSDYQAEKLMLTIDIDNRNYNHLREIILEVDPQAFIMVSEAQNSVNGYFTSNNNKKK